MNRAQEGILQAAAGTARTGIAATALAAAVVLGACGQRPPTVPEIPRDVIGTDEGFRSGMPTSNNPPPG